jgi:hypothetical protein
MQEQARADEIEQDRRNQVADFIAEHPTYDKSLFLFSQTSRIRRFMQSLVDPSFGTERINGRAADPKRRRIFSFFILAAIVASVAVAGIATPLERRQYYLDNGPTRWTWYNLVEAHLGIIFVGEAVVKWIADGFLFSPNAYLLSLWNDIDFFVSPRYLSSPISPCLPCYSLFRV